MIFFTADQHHRHKNIINYCDRPFDTVEEMDEVMIERWNERVGHDDTIYQLGDFSLHWDVAHYFSRLNGRIYVLETRWHHDRRWLANFRASLRGDESIFKSRSNREVQLVPPIHILRDDWNWTGDIHFLKRGEPNIVLCHYPFERWEKSHHGSWHLHGHSHGRLKPRGLRMDIGVDAHDFYPVSLDEVRKFMEARKNG